MEQTLSIIKPDAVRAKKTGEIISMFENNGFNIIAIKKVFLNQEQARQFYIIHKERPFYNELVDFMTSGPCIVMILEKKDAVLENRRIMGATNPAEADEGSIRKLYGTSIDSNAVHGSDSPENAIIEINFFFNSHEIINISK